VIPPDLHVYCITRSPHDDNVLNRRTIDKRTIYRRFEFNNAAAPESPISGNHGLRLGVIYPVLERFR
jgi:hypothetical protein